MQMEVNQPKEFEKVLLPEDTYPATLKEIKEGKPFLDTATGQEKPRFALIFSLQTKQGVKDLAILVSKVMSPLSNLGKIYEKLVEPLTDTAMVDTDDMLGKQCRVLVENYTKDGVKRSGISKVLEASA